ncbi:MAG: hypothetical protein KAT71_02300 [Gammaproteobacteria bacterium]|nr:hypothetical protein [Gammaproteobacteria bacterium]
MVTRGGSAILPNIKKVSWEEIRVQVKNVNKELFQVIDNLSPGPDYTLYKAVHPFGHESVKGGTLFLPDKDGHAVSLLDHSDKEMRDDLSYNVLSNPVSLVLKNSFEIFMAMEQHTIPFALVPEGKLISTWLVLEPGVNHQPAFLWNVSAGARSMFMLPKISINSKYNQLKRLYNLNSEVPDTLLKQVDFFRELANSDDFGQSWSAEILYFGKNWFKHLNDKHQAWVEFYNYLYKNTWGGSGFMRTEFFWNLVFSLIQKKRNLRPNPYIADTTKHILAMGVGAYPGFAPATDDSAAPISRLQEIIINDYKLEGYAPIIMHPSYFSMYQKTSPIYYSLQYPTTFNFSPTSKKTSNKIIDLLEIQYLLQKYLSEIVTDSLNINGTPLASIPTQVQYDFFHSNPERYNEVIDSDQLSVDDTRFLSAFSGRKFSAKTPFLRGCIRISSKT